MTLLNPNIKLIGRREYIDLPWLNLNHIEAKVDTGAYTCAIHCESIAVMIENQKQVLCVKLLDANGSDYKFSEFTLKKIKNSFGEMEERYIIKTLIRIGRKKIRTTISLSDRGNMRYPVLIGRRLLKGKFIVDVSQVYTNGIRLNKLMRQKK
ncbi:MAG: ATP-dependent zinc protease [Bacteroidetes bacterium]|nr:ATP-dependent zinc protease [Bacteroidota bacterium]